MQGSGEGLGPEGPERARWREGFAGEGLVSAGVVREGLVREGLGQPDRARIRPRGPSEKGMAWAKVPEAPSPDDVHP